MFKFITCGRNIVAVNKLMAQIPSSSDPSLSPGPSFPLLTCAVTGTLLDLAPRVSPLHTPPNLTERLLEMT